jgi:5S rRNA maturation endonuclease (ribonuclease M5)
MKLKVSLMSGNAGSSGRTSYYTKINADNYKEIYLVLLDLDRKGLPIKKAIKEFNLSNSDWNIALGI